MLAVLTIGMKQDVFHEQVKDRLERWTKAIALVLMEAGLDAQTARQRSEDALVAVQGSLILSRGLGDAGIFRRAIARLPKDLCEGL